MANVIEVETFGRELKIRFDDGSSEEVEGGRYERKNANGDTVEERSATQDDIDRLIGLATSFEQSLGAIDADVVKVEREGASIEITYDDGSKEEIEGAKYEREGPNDADLIERAASAADLARIEALIDDFLAAGGIIQDDDNGGRRRGRDDDDRNDMRGSRRDDDLRGSRNDDDIVGGRGDDDIRAKGGDDVIRGGKGGDRVKGGAGDDDISGGDGRDRLHGGAGADTIDGGDGNDRIKGDRGDDSLTGGAGNDRVSGGKGDDIVLGGDGDDRVKGGAGADLIDGGAGSDRYWGNGGADTFVFGVDGEFDKIHNYVDGVDVIDISAFGLTGIDEVLAAATEDGDDLLIDLGGGDVIKVDNATLNQLSADDFIF